MFMCTGVHAILHFVVIWLTIVKHVVNINTKNTGPFLALFMAPNENFIKFMFGNMTKTEQGLKLTEISELIELFSFILTQQNNRFPAE